MRLVQHLLVDAPCQGPIWLLLLLVSVAALTAYRWHRRPRPSAAAWLLGAVREAGGLSVADARRRALAAGYTQHEFAVALEQLTLDGIVAVQHPEPPLTGLRVVAP